MAKQNRPFAGSLKWVLIGFLAAGISLLSYHFAYHEPESDADIHAPASEGFNQR